MDKTLGLQIARESAMIGNSEPKAIVSDGFTGLPLSELGPDDTLIRSSSREWDSSNGREGTYLKSGAFQLCTIDIPVPGVRRKATP